MHRFGIKSHLFATVAIQGIFARRQIQIAIFVCVCMFACFEEAFEDEQGEEEEEEDATKEELKIPKSNRLLMIPARLPAFSLGRSPINRN